MDNKKILNKIINYTDKINVYINDMNYTEFVNDMKVQDACLMNLSQIGESVTQLEDSFLKKHNEINWNEIKGMRNVIIHDYDGVNIRIVWDTIKFDLPELKEKLKKLL